MNINYRYRAVMNRPLVPGMRGRLALWLRRLAGRLDGGFCFAFLVQGNISHAGLKDVCEQLPRHMHRDLDVTMHLEAADQGYEVETSSVWRAP